MVGLESTLEQAETAKKVKKPEVAEAERETREVSGAIKST